jgi:hypothetical protein
MRRSIHNPFLLNATHHLALTWPAEYNFESVKYIKYSTLIGAAAREHSVPFTLTGASITDNNARYAGCVVSNDTDKTAYHYRGSVRFQSDRPIQVFPYIAIANNTGDTDYWYLPKSKVSVGGEAVGGYSYQCDWDDHWIRYKTGTGDSENTLAGFMVMNQSGATCNLQLLVGSIDVHPFSIPPAISFAGN